MPTTYAHYRFGKDALSAMPEPLQNVISEHRTLFDFGVHGPDLLFYDRPFVKTEINQLGYRSHERTGRDFFAQGAKTVLSCADKDGGLSYLLGVLCHFALDRECHPYVGQKEKTGVSHSAIEASFDRFLMETDGLDLLRFDPTEHLKPSRRGAVTIAEFYPPLEPEDIFGAEKSMAFYLSTLAVPPGVRRKAIALGLKKMGKADLLIPKEYDPRCADSDRRLFSHYQDALILMKTLVPELLRYMEDGTPLGLGYDHTFGEV